MSEIITVQDLETLKKHEIFEAEVLTGRVGGLATGAYLATATNAATGQIQKTLPQILREIGFKPGSGDFTTGFTVMPGQRDYAWFDPVSQEWYSYLGVIPTLGFVVAPGTNPVGDPDWLVTSEHLFTQIGVGAVTRQAQDKMREVAVSVGDYGVVGDGITIEHVKMQAAIDAVNAAGGGTLEIPPNMTIKCAALLYGKKGVSIKCDPTSWLDFSGSGFITPTNNLSLFGYYGTAGAFITPTADMVKGSNKIAVPSAASFKIGDMIELSMDSNGQWDDSSTTVTAGQLAIVTSVFTGTNNIVISEPLYETLPLASGARIRIIDPIEDVTIDGLGIIGNGRNPAGNADQGLKIFFGRNCHIRNCRLKDVDTQAIGMISCYGGSIKDNRLDTQPLGDTDVISYGAAYSCSMHLEISGNHCINFRHSVVSSHLARSHGYYGINRFIDIHDNFITSNYGDLGSGGWPASHAGIANHTDAEFLNIHDNTIVACRFGINVRTANNSIKNNKIYDCHGGIYFSAYWADLEVSGNELYNCELPFLTDAVPIEVSRGTINISDTLLEGCGGIVVTFPTTVPSTLIFNRNTVRDGTFGGATAMLASYNNHNLIASYNIIGVSNTLAFRINGTGGQIITDNTIISSTPYSTASILVDLSTNFTVKNNAIIAPAASTNGGIACPTRLAAPKSIVTNNDFIGI